MLGKVIAEKYRIDALIGSGGMANVYKACDLQEGRTVALKVLKEEHREDAEFLRRFEREARAVLSLSHPNIVQSYDVGVDENGVNFIVLEYVEGRTLKEHIAEKGSLSPKEAVYIASEVLEALEHAHECGIIHWDVKPQNVMIYDDGKRIKLTDFGIARDAAATTRTFAGTNVIGSVHYISPEQAKGENVTAESDIYSCAIMVYEMLTGTVPFAGDNTVAIALKHLQEEMVPPMEVNGKVSRAMSDVVMKGAAKEPELRYSSAGEFKNDLNRALKEPNGRFAYIKKQVVGEEGKPRPVSSSPMIIKISVAVMCAISIFVTAAFITGVIGGDDGNGEELLIPALEGKPLEEARSLAERRGFVLSVADYVMSNEYPAGQVVRQSPVNGIKGGEGDTIVVEVSSGSSYAIVPDLVGGTIQEASLMLAEENLSVGSVTYDPTSDRPEGTILRQEPVAETQSPEFETVDIWVSGSETKLLEMPPVTGQAAETAVTMLEESGLSNVWLRIAEPQEGAQDGVVVQQSPAAHMSMGKDTLTEIWICSADSGAYAADIAINLDIEGQEQLVAVTAALGNGMELVLYEGKVQPGPRQPISFIAYMPTGGEYECIVYADGAEVKRLSASFTRR